MSHRRIRYRTLPSLFIIIFMALFPTAAEARSGIDVPPLEAFIEQVTNGEAGVLRGVYVPGVLAGRISTQPEDNNAFVSSAEGTLTQFSLAAQYGSTGLLAHNYLAGKYFSLLQRGQVFYLIYGDGRVEAFIVTRLLRFQALDPNNIQSDFLDLKSGAILTAATLFNKTYGKPGRVVLQTCIDRYGNSSWGRLFIVAEPYQAGNH